MIEKQDIRGILSLLETRMQSKPLKVNSEVTEMQDASDWAYRKIARRRHSSNLIVRTSKIQVSILLLNQPGECFPVKASTFACVRQHKLLHVGACSEESVNFILNPSKRLFYILCLNIALRGLSESCEPELHRDVAPNFNRWKFKFYLKKIKIDLTEGFDENSRGAILS